jgi:DNA-binding NarL/FixJ family response regulator
MAKAFEDVDDLRVETVAGAVDELDTELGYDVTLLDLYLTPRTEGRHSGGPCLDLIARLSASSVPVLVVSASQNPDDVLAAIRAGAMGYVTKSSQPEFLVSAARTVAAGGFAFSPDLAGVLHRAFSGPRPAASPDIGPLSPREAETLRMVARGLTHSQIATRMRVSKSTVNTHVERIRVKLKVGNKAELTRLALETFPDLTES